MIGLYETLGRRDAPRIRGAFLSWVDRESDRPFFAFLNYFDAHSPYQPPAPFDSRFGRNVAGREPYVIEELNRSAKVDSGVVQIETDAYDSGIAYLDHEIGLLFEELERRGKLDNTIVIITADHGEELGDHGRWGHAYSLHSELLHVPLLIIAPRGPAGVRVAHPISLRNVPATIADLADLEGSPFPGSSLANHWRALETGAIVEDTVLSVFGKYRSLYIDGYHYLHGVLDGKEHVYDYMRDPHERENLAGSPGVQALMQSARALLARIAPPPKRLQTDQPDIPPPEG